MKGSFKKDTGSTKVPTGKGFSPVHLVECCPIHPDVSDGVRTGEISQFENRGRMQRSAMSHRQRFLVPCNWEASADEPSLAV